MTWITKRTGGVPRSSANSLIWTSWLGAHAPSRAVFRALAEHRERWTHEHARARVLSETNCIVSAWQFNRERATRTRGEQP